MLRDTSTSMRIQRAREEHLEAIRDIYNHEVLHGTATFDTEPVSLEERRAWLSRHDSDRHPALVATSADVVLGWASLSPWSERRAYARSAEVSVYVHPDQRGRGVGKALLEAVIAAGRSGGLGVLLARVTSESEVSLRLHREHGFASVGTLRRVGEKHGRILDVEILELHLDEAAAET